MGGKTGILKKAGKKEKKNNPAQIFCILMCVSLICLVFLFLFTNGKTMDHFFFWDTADSGMDFFNSIRYIWGRWPYKLYSTLYPPLANLFFLLMYAFVPREITDTWGQDASIRRTELDLRTYQCGFMLYMIVVIVSLAILVALAYKYMNEKNIKYAGAVSMLFCFSYGSLYAVERGNIILLTAGLSLFFIVFYRSENRILKELALISLAIAAGFKLYPAFLGVLLLKEGDKKVIFRTILYGILGVVMPCFAFREGLEAIPLWLEVLSEFGSDSVQPWFGNGIDCALANAAHLLDLILNTNLAAISWKYVAYAIALIFLAAAFFMDKLWESVLALTFVMLFQSQADYFYCMSLIPLLLFLTEEKKITKENIIPFVIMMCMVLPFPLLYCEDEFYPRDILIHVSVFVLLFRDIAIVVPKMRRHRNEAGS
ncbi:MAG: DUF2029 domain-containing protein [Lachnospiraceae bacterium]|nr:DUF2029 domain-containing protein [Lachnospiraceae bacterium]